MKRNVLRKSVFGLGLGAATLLGGNALRAEPPAVAVPPRDVPAVRDARENARVQARDARIDAREARRQRRPFRDWGLTLGQATARGLEIAAAATNSVAYQAGLRQGDVVVSINGHPVQGQADFDNFAYSDDVNGRAKVVVMRNGREAVLYLEPSALYLDAAPANDLDYFGVAIDDRYPDRIIVRRVLPNSPAFSAGLREGDVITSWHGQPIRSAAEFQRTVREAQPGAVDFEYSRDSKVARGEAKFGPREAPRANVNVDVNRPIAPAPERAPVPERPAPERVPQR